MTPARRRGQAGVIGGSDGLLFAMLILFAGSLVLVNIWGRIDTRAALDGAARDYLRSYTEQVDATSAELRGESAARTLLRERGTPVRDLRIDVPSADRFGPCASATVRLTAEIPAARLPFLDDLGATTIEVVHTELIDPHREVEPGANYSVESTPCAES